MPIDALELTGDFGEVRGSGGPEHLHAIGQGRQLAALYRPQGGEHGRVDRGRALAAADHQDDSLTDQAKLAPHSHRVGFGLRPAYWIAVHLNGGVAPRAQMLQGFRITEVELIDPAREPPGGESGVAVLLLDRSPQAPGDRPRDNGTGGVTPGAHNQLRRERPEHMTNRVAASDR